MNLKSTILNQDFKVRLKSFTKNLLTFVFVSSQESAPVPVLQQRNFEIHLDPNPDLPSGQPNLPAAKFDCFDFAAMLVSFVILAFATAEPDSG